LRRYTVSKLREEPAEGGKGIERRGDVWVVGVEGAIGAKRFVALEEVG
jgi:hypothetical protein